MPLLTNYLSNQHAITRFSPLFNQSVCYYISSSTNTHQTRL